jgi:hypothetical protein
MDKTSQVLAQGPPGGVSRSYRAIADHNGVPRSTFHHRALGHRALGHRSTAIGRLKKKPRASSTLPPFEEEAVVEFILQMVELGTPVGIKSIPSIAFSVARSSYSILIVQ